MEAALTMLLRAKAKHQSVSGTGTGTRTLDSVLEYNYSDHQIQTDVDNAFSLLTVAHNVSTVQF